MNQKYSLAPLAALLALTPLAAQAQTGSVGIGTTAPNASAALDIVSSNKGLLVPRVASVASIANPAPGLLVYQTGAPAGFYYNSGPAGTTSWQQIGTTTQADNLGNHTATTNLGLNGNWLSNAPGNANGLRVDNSGNVGIGTAVPTQKLDVGGGILARGSGLISTQGTYLEWNRSGNRGETLLLNQRGTGAGGIAFGSSDAVSSGSNAVTEWGRFDTNGRFGVGTALPGHPLTVQAPAGSTALLGFSTNTGNDKYNFSLSSGGLNLSESNVAGGRLFIKDGGRVGIGTTNPSQQLEVAGGLLARGNDRVSSQGAHLLWNLSGFQGETWLLNQRGGGAGGLVFGASDTATVRPNTRTEWGRFRADGNFGLGTADPGQKLEVAGNVQISGTGNGLKFPDNTTLTTANRSLALSGQSLTLGGPGGNTVTLPTNTGPAGPNGIGIAIRTSTEPAGANCAAGGTKVEVAPDFNNNGQIDANEAGNIVTRYLCNGSNATVTGSNGITVNNGVVGLGGPLTANTDVALNGRNLTFSGSGGVGIGVGTPTQKLDVEGGILARSNGLISNQGAYLQWNRNNGDGATWLLNQQGGGGGGIIFGQSNAVGTGTNTVAEWGRFNGSGNLGLGTPNPSQKLDVRGNLRLGDDTSPATYPVTGQTIEFVGPNFNTDPVGLYRVNPASDQSELRVAVGDGADANDKFVVGRSSATAEGALATGTFTPSFTVRGDGNVGVGTSTPSQKLDVRGNLRLGDDGGNAGTGQAIEWVGPGVNSDPVGLYRVNPAVDQSELRVVVGDSPDANDKFSVGRTSGGTEGQIPGGIFTPNFTVLSDGNVDVRGDYKYKTAQVRHLTLGNPDFIPESKEHLKSLYQQPNGVEYFYAGTMRAPIHVPDGATITGFTVRYGDNTTAADLTVELRSMRFVSSQTLIGSFTSSGANPNVLTVPNPVNAVVNNDGSFYYVRVQFGSNASTLGIFSVEIDYTVSQAD